MLPKEQRTCDVCMYTNVNTFMFIYVGWARLRLSIYMAQLLQLHSIISQIKYCVNELYIFSLLFKQHLIRI